MEKLTDRKQRIIKNENSWRQQEKKEEIGIRGVCLAHFSSCTGG